MARYRIKGTSGASVNRSYELGKRLLIGRADDCDVRIENAEVSAHHCELTIADDGSVMLRDLGSGSGTRVNGSVVDTAALASGDEISVANCRFLLQAPGLRPERVLTEDAVRQKRNHAPWLLAVAVVLGLVLAWRQGWLQLIAG